MKKVLTTKGSIFRIGLLYFIINICICFFPRILIGYLVTDNIVRKMGIVYLILGINDYIAMYGGMKILFLRKELREGHNKLVNSTFIYMILGIIIRGVNIGFSNYHNMSVLIVYLILIVGILLIEIPIIRKKEYKIMKINEYKEKKVLMKVIMGIGIIISIVSFSFII